MKQGRVHIRLSEELAKDIKSYAERHHTTVTALVEDYFRDLLKEERSSDIEVG